MKTLVLSMISIAATIAAMTACTSESDPINEIPNPKDAKVEIKLTAGVVNVETKASPVSSSAATEFAEGTIIQLIRWDHEGTLSDLTWGTDTYQKVNATASGTTINFTNPQYYKEDGKSTSFIGFYPALAEGKVTLSDNGTVQFTGLDGQTDILSAELINVGKQTSVSTDAKIQFKHMLSQIKFKLSGTSAADDAFGNIKKISLVDVPQDMNMTLGKDAATTTIKISDNASKADITVVQAEDQTSGTPITSLDKEYILLTPPELGSSSLNLQIKIETTNREEPISININDFGDTGTGSGTANEITLTFKDKITVTTAIADWSEGQNKNYGVE